jgi:hypothetical protein
MKKLAVVVSGWYFPYHFYKTLTEQFIPEGWEVDFFCVAHREPKYAEKEVKDHLKILGRNLRAGLDRKLYKKIATQDQLEKLGWKFMLEPNTVGDWGNTNQWLEKHDYKDYDLFLFSHDDNLILSYQLFHNIIEGEEYLRWLIMSNSTGMPPGNLRGSFEFFKRDMLDIMGGKFDLSQTTLTRIGENKSPKNWADLFDWNATVYPLAQLIQEKNLVSQVAAMSPCYRVSMFCIEGERGYISNTHGINTEQEEKGLATLQHFKII